jgi:outer membrane protein OmpA-like peptidoglycan-associated protein
MARDALFAVLFAIAGSSNQPVEARQSVVFFRADSSVLTPEARQVVVRTAAAIRETRPAKIMVEGHADGGTPHDERLASQRARTVISALEDAGLAATPVELSQAVPPAEASELAAHNAVIRLVP